MKSLIALSSLCAASFVVASISGAATVAARAAQPLDVAAAATAARPLSILETRRLFENKSWMWDDGAGYFDTSKRAFTAWTKAGSAGSYAEGLWFIGDDGALCFNAKWHAIDGIGDALTCFAHRTDGQRIFQRREPDGAWYVFASSPRRKSDEIRKLRRDDHVFWNYERNKLFLQKAATPH